MKKLLVLALDGVMDSSLAVTLDTLRTAQRFFERSGRRGGLQWSVIGSRRTISTAGGLRATAGCTIREALANGVDAEWLLVPGLDMTSRRAIEARLARTDARAIGLLRVTVTALASAPRRLAGNALPPHRRRHRPVPGPLPPAGRPGRQPVLSPLNAFHRDTRPYGVWQPRLPARLPEASCRPSAC
ncbi:MAG TPA: hypothetical protein VF846_07870 [Thermoanaerobaculia bacterium]|jgi:hypothetical protein